MWTPLLTDDSATRAWEVIERIAGELRSASPEAVNLADGSAGFALLFAYLFEHAERDEDLEAMSRHLELAVAGIESLDSMRLLDGVTGVGWVVEHVAGEADGPDLVEAIDAALLETLDIWQGPYDLSMGLVGFGLYGLERWGRPGGPAIAGAVAEALLDRFDGETWPTPPNHLPPVEREQTPAGRLNLGAAHGAFGAIGFLAGLAARTGDPSILDAADRAVDWIAGVCREAPLPYHIPIGEGERAPARLAWCYGEAGAAAALLAAAELAGRDRWRELAIELADAGAARSLQGSGVNAPGLCHGSAGLGHIYNRIGQRTGDARYLETARRWFEHTLASPIEPDDFLNGAAGVGLALLAAIGEVEPEWDRTLLMSLDTEA